MNLTILAALHASQAATPPPPPAPASMQISPVAEVRKADGSLAARAMVFVARGPIQIRIQAAGLAPGRYGAHIHDIGRCDGPDFESAGPHWNPTGRRHGSLNPQGPHLGDLPNLEIGEDGHGRVEFGTPGELGGSGGLFDADGAAIVIHAAPDDGRTDPAGNSGARIACGVLSPPTD